MAKDRFTPNNLIAEKERNKLPQNILTLLQDIGEKSVLFHLYLKIKDTDWAVYQNLGDKGCDIILQRESPGKNTKINKIRIEVKTRQKFYSTSKKKNPDRSTKFLLSKNEYDQCDFLVGFWYDKNAYFIVPKEILRPAGSKFMFFVSQSKDGQYNAKCKKYWNRWDLIECKLLN